MNIDASISFSSQAKPSNRNNTHITNEEFNNP